MKVFGVFLENELIFAGDISYAIYEKEIYAVNKAKKMHRYYLNDEYKVRAIEIDCGIISGIFVD